MQLIGLKIAPCQLLTTKDNFDANAEISLLWIIK